jgi:hypothetical protein
VSALMARIKVRVGTLTSTVRARTFPHQGCDRLCNTAFAEHATPSSIEIT